MILTASTGWAVHHGYVHVPNELRRDHLAFLAAVAAPLLLTVILVPFRASFPNTDAAWL